MISESNKLYEHLCLSQKKVKPLKIYSRSTKYMNKVMLGKRY